MIAAGTRISIKICGVGENAAIDNSAAGMLIIFPPPAFGAIASIETIADGTEADAPAFALGAYAANAMLATGTLISNAPSSASGAEANGARPSIFYGSCGHVGLNGSTVFDGKSRNA